VSSGIKPLTLHPATRSFPSIPDPPPRHPQLPKCPRQHLPVGDLFVVTRLMPLITNRLHVSCPSSRIAYDLLLLQSVPPAASQASPPALARWRSRYGTRFALTACHMRLSLNSNASPAPHTPVTSLTSPCHIRVTYADVLRHSTTYLVRRVPLDDIKYNDGSTHITTRGVT